MVFVKEKDDGFLYINKSCFRQMVLVCRLFMYVTNAIRVM